VPGFYSGRSDDWFVLSLAFSDFNIHQRLAAVLLRGFGGQQVVRTTNGCPTRTGADLAPRWGVVPPTARAVCLTSTNPSVMSGFLRSGALDSVRSEDLPSQHSRPSAVRSHRPLLQRGPSVSTFFAISLSLLTVQAYSHRHRDDVSQLSRSLPAARLPDGFRSILCTQPSLLSFAANRWLRRLERGLCQGQGVC
jgi:hypothetical protein